MDLVRHLRFFVAIADEQHFGHAARTLGMSQPPLSQGLRRLEQELGVQLFVRNAREVSLTPAGAELLPRARGLLEASQQFVELARQRRDEGAALRIGTVAELRPALVAAIGAAAVAVPGVGRVEVVVEPTVLLADRVAAGRLDVAVLRHPAVLAGVEAGDVVRLATRVLLPEGHPAAQGPVRLSALRGLPLATPPRAHHPAAHDLLVDTCGRHGLPVRTVTAEDDRAALVLAATGQAFAFTADPDLHGPGAVALDVVGDPVPLRLRVVWNAARPPTSGTRERIEDVLRGEAG